MELGGQAFAQRMLRNQLFKLSDEWRSLA